MKGLQFLNVKHCIQRAECERNSLASDQFDLSIPGMDEENARNTLSYQQSLEKERDLNAERIKSDRG